MATHCYLEEVAVWAVGKFSRREDVIVDWPEFLNGSHSSHMIDMWYVVMAMVLGLLIGALQRIIVQTPVKHTQQVSEL